jgi:type IV pilus biogenesis protein CpaD/CtpE
MKNTGLGCLAAVALLSLGCGDRLHMTNNYGHARNAVMAAQTVNPGAGERPRSLPGFSAQEATIVAKNYRQSLAAPPKPGQTEDRGMVVLAPSSAGQPYVPPPSVPDRK